MSILMSRTEICYPGVWAQSAKNISASRSLASGNTIDKRSLVVALLQKLRHAFIVCNGDGETVADPAYILQNTQLLTLLFHTKLRQISSSKYAEKGIEVPVLPYFWCGNSLWTFSIGILKIDSATLRTRFDVCLRS